MKIKINMFEVMNFNKIAEIVYILRYKIRRKDNLACSVYKTKNGYMINSSSEATAGFLVESLQDVIIISGDADANQLQNAVFEALAKSAKIVPTPKRDLHPKHKKENLRLLKEHLKLMKEKSFTSLNKNSSGCNLRYENSVMTIAPYQYYNPKKPSQGLVYVEEDIVEISNAMERKDEVISSLIELLGRDYK